MQTFTIIFVIALILTTYLRIWLSSRHVRHIQSHRDRVPDEFLTQIDLASHQKAADYTCSKTRLSYINTLIEALLLLCLTLGGGLNALSTLWSEWLGISTSIDGRSTDHPITHGVALIISTVMMMSLVEIPLSYYRTFVIEQRFGFNKMTPGMFFADLVKQTTLGVLIGTPLLLGILWLMKEMGDHWWLYAWLAWMGFNLLILAVYPTWIAPLFNKFTPLTDDALKSRIEQLMHKCGFESSGLFVMDGSRRSNHGNAYFTGFGRTKRIVFFDTPVSYTHLTLPTKRIV